MRGWLKIIESITVTRDFENNVYDGVIEMLEKLRKKGFRLAIATSKPEMFAKQIADYFGFSKYLTLSAEPV